MTRRTLAILTAAAALAIPASAHAVVLVNPQGQPIGGALQAEADRLQVPTPAGSLIVVPPTQLCDGTTACSVGPPFHPDTMYGDGDGYVSGMAVPEDVAPELGHIFDWRYLTPATRARFAVMWGVPNDPWVDSDAGLAAGVEDGLEGAFQVAYEDCAYGIGEGNTDTVQWGASTPTITFDQRTCQLIDQIGAQAGAMPPASPPVHVAVAAPVPSGAYAERRSHHSERSAHHRHHRR